MRMHLYTLYIVHKKLFIEFSFALNFFIVLKICELLAFNIIASNVSQRLWEDTVFNLIKSMSSDRSEMILKYEEQNVDEYLDFWLFLAWKPWTYVQKVVNLKCR